MLINNNPGTPLSSFYDVSFTTIQVRYSFIYKLVLSSYLIMAKQYITLNFHRYCGFPLTQDTHIIDHKQCRIFIVFTVHKLYTLNSKIKSS